MAAKSKAMETSCTFARDSDVPMKDALKWIDESFRAVAPKRVVDGLRGSRTP